MTSFVLWVMHCACIESHAAQYRVWFILCQSKSIICNWPPTNSTWKKHTGKFEKFSSFQEKRDWIHYSTAGWGWWEHYTCNFHVTIRHCNWTPLASRESYSVTREIHTWVYYTESSLIHWSLFFERCDFVFFQGDQHRTTLGHLRDMFVGYAWRIPYWELMNDPRRKVAEMRVCDVTSDFLHHQNKGNTHKDMNAQKHFDWKGTNFLLFLMVC